MAGKKNLRFIMKELNVGLHTIVDYLKEKGYDIPAKPTTKIDEEIYNILLEKFDVDRKLRSEAEKAAAEHREQIEKIKEKAKPKAEPVEKPQPEEKPIVKKPKVLGKIDIEPKKETPAQKEEKEKIETKEEKPVESIQPEEISEEEIKEEKPVIENIETQIPSKPSLNFTGEKIKLDDIPSDTKPKKKIITKKEREKIQAKEAEKKRKRKRISKPRVKAKEKQEITPEEMMKIIKARKEKLEENLGKKDQKKKLKRLKREKKKEKIQKILEEESLKERTLQLAEYASVSELAGLMDIDPIDLVSKAFEELGIVVTVNQRLDAETIELLAQEYGYEVNFNKVDELEEEEEEEEETDNEADLVKRPPIVTIMGHVDHGKTSLLDYIRKTNVVAGEAGGITQHIGAYSVTLDNGEKITFLDTPGHEAFTAMRARGTQVTDIAVIVIAADDAIMPQTKEAINHATAAGVPMIFAINKVDKPNADPEKIKNQLAQMNLLVEDWGGKYQSQEISAKTGQGIPELLEKILLEAELLELKANPNRKATGTVLEASLEKGKGYTANILVQNGTLKIGDYMVAGRNHGKVRAMFDERGKRVKEAGPATPVQIIGLNGAPKAGDKFKVYEDERQAKKIAQKRDQIFREQELRSKKHLTLDELGRRIAAGDFKELNLIIKGDVDGSVEALSDALTKLSTEQVNVNIIHKGVGQITEADVNLAAASDAIIIGFNVRPSGNANKLANEEGVQIKTYSVIYDAIDDVKNALENMLSPVEREEVTGTAAVRQTFKISKIGTVAGCMVTSGKIYNKSRVRVIRDGIVIHDGELSSLKRFKDDVKEVSKGYECGLTIKNYNDIKEGDIIEAYDVKVEKQKL